MKERFGGRGSLAFWGRNFHSGLSGLREPDGDCLLSARDFLAAAAALELALLHSFYLGFDALARGRRVLPRTFFPGCHCILPQPIQMATKGGTVVLRAPI
jgi:hypothetical protein